MTMFLGTFSCLLLKKLDSIAGGGDSFSFVSLPFMLVNCEAARFFCSSRGLLQGDPLSPLLFILVIETLSRLVNKAIEVGLLEGFLISNSHSESMLISYLLFADC